LRNGSRRVVASNWYVDDRAAASLVSYFCSGVAKAEGTGEQADYATALHGAKQWVRSQDQ
jgi:CHAT domain-containing protein